MKMKFKIGDKVRVKEKLISKLYTLSLIKTLKMGGIVIDASRSDGIIKVEFPSNYKYNIWCEDLEVIKNQQLLFDFMD